MSTFSQWLSAQAKRADDQDPVRKLALIWDNTSEGRPRVHSPTGVERWISRLAEAHEVPQHSLYVTELAGAPWPDWLKQAVYEYQHRGDSDITRISTPAAEDRLVRIEHRLDQILAALGLAGGVAPEDRATAEEERATYLPGPGPGSSPGTPAEPAPDGPESPAGGLLARIVNGGSPQGSAAFWGGLYAAADFTEPDEDPGTAA